MPGSGSEVIEGYGGLIRGIETTSANPTDADT